MGARQILFGFTWNPGGLKPAGIRETIYLKVRLHTGFLRRAVPGKVTGVCALGLCSDMGLCPPP